MHLCALLSSQIVYAQLFYVLFIWQINDDDDDEVAAIRKYGDIKGWGLEIRVRIVKLWPPVKFVNCMSLANRYTPFLLIAVVLFHLQSSKAKLMRPRIKTSWAINVNCECWPLDYCGVNQSCQQEERTSIRHGVEDLLNGSRPEVVIRHVTIGINPPKLSVRRPENSANLARSRNDQREIARSPPNHCGSGVCEV